MDSKKKKCMSVALLLTGMLFCLSCEKKSSIITKDVAFKSGEVSVFSPAQTALAGIDQERYHIAKNENDQYVLRLLENYEDAQSLVNLQQSAVSFDELWPESSIISTGQWGGLKTSYIGRSSFTYSFLNDGEQYSQSLTWGMKSRYDTLFAEIKEVYLDKPIVLSFGSTVPVSVMEGFEITFPDDIFVRKNPASKLDFTVVDGHRIVIGSELPIPAGSRTLQLELILEKILVSENQMYRSSLETRVIFRSKVGLLGDYVFYTKDFEIIPTSFNVLYDISVTDSEAGLSILGSLEPMTYVTAGSMAALHKVPDILKEKGLSIDKNPYFYLDVENGLPVPIKFSTDLNNSVGSIATLVKGRDRVTIPAFGKGQYFFLAGKCCSLPQDRVTIFAQSLQYSGFMDEMPTQVFLDNMTIQLSDDCVEYQINKDQYGGVRMAYTLEVPLQYCADGPLTLIHECDAGLGLHVPDGVQSLVVNMEIENNAGFAPTLSVVATDKDGEAYVDTEVKVEQAIKIGQTTSLTLVMPVAAGGMTVDGFKLAYTIPVPGPELDSYLYDFSTINVKNLRVALQGPSDLL